MILTSHVLGHLVVCMSRKHNGNALCTEYALSIGVATMANKKVLFVTLVDLVSRFDAHWSQFFAEFDWLVVLMSCLDAYISRYADFCVNDNDNNDDTTNYFTPYACARGNNKEGGVSYSTVQQLLGKIVIIKSYLCLNSLHTLSALVHASASVILHGFPPSHG